MAPERHAGPVAHGYAQTPAQLYQQMRGAGWNAPALERVRDACDYAITLFSDLFRACGKPFLCHGVGTASILLRYGAPLALVKAGLVHAAYSHGRYPPLRGKSRPKQRYLVRKNLGRGTEELIHRYDAYDWSAGPPTGDLDSLDCRDAGIFLLRMANDLEEQLDLSLAYTSKPRELGPDWQPFFDELAEKLGVPGLAKQLDAATEATLSASIPEPLRGAEVSSYAIEPWSRKREAMGRRRKLMKSKWRRGLHRLLMPRM